MYTKPLLALAMLSACAITLLGIASWVHPQGTSAPSGVFSTGYQGSTSPEIQPTYSHASSSSRPQWVSSPQGWEGVSASSSISQTVAPTANIRTSAEELFSRLTGTNASQQDTPKTPELLWEGLLTSEFSTTKRAANTTPEQKALYDYGNALGALLKTFEDTHTGQEKVLGDFFNQQSSPESLLRLASDYKELADDIARIDAPAAAATIHTHMHTSYAHIADAIESLSLTTSETMNVDTVTAYNEAAAAVAKDIIALVALFQTFQVSFDALDPGHVFVFTAL